MRIDGVFSGGGVKAYAFLGALKSLKEHNLQLERVAGTSSGAILASLIAAKYESDEIEMLLTELHLKQFLDPPKLTQIIPFSKWFFLYFQMGLYKGDKLEKWLYHQLAHKNIYTFQDIEKNYLKVVVSDLSLGKLVVIPDDLERVYGINPASFPVSKAIRMSAGFPYFFMPKKLLKSKIHQSIVVDGGLLSNFPLWIFENENGESKRPIIGVKLRESTHNQPRQINNGLDLFHALFTTMKQAHDSRYISKRKINNIVFIPVENIDTVDLTIDRLTKKDLIQTGKKSTDQFLKYWPK